MKYYLAPLEGITTYVYRNAYAKYFGDIDKYFTPFIVPHKEKKFNTREMKELSPEHNNGIFVVPQLLTNNAQDFIKTAKDIKALGYDEINLNLGCPSKTVVAKGKGAGFLAFPKKLEIFLDEIFLELDMKISIKSRIGKENPEEFEHIMDIYNRFPIHELILHPRVQADYYQNIPRMDTFEHVYENRKMPLCYNGDIFSAENCNDVTERFPSLRAIMIGRGIIHNPGLIAKIKNNNSLSKEVLYQFHQDILEEYIKISFGERNVLFKMKELWDYMIDLFEDSAKIKKTIKKAERLDTYNAAIKLLFERGIRQNEYISKN